MHRAIARGLNLRNLSIGVGLTTATGAGAMLYALENAVRAADFTAHPIALQWPHSGPFDSFDYASVRRGYQVYKQVCSACHSLKFIKFRHFVDIFMTEDEAKAEAAEALVKDLGDHGEPIERPGTLTDGPPAPYPNDKAAAAANSGSVPPDLSLVILARHGFDDYFFSLLTGYMEPPAGVKVDEGKAYNPYFTGGVIAMPQQLFDEGIEYKDGTPATQSQQAKDVITFLRWCAEPFHDKRKQLALKILVLIPIVGIVILYAKKYHWTLIKSQKYAWAPTKGREPPATKSPPTI